MLICNVEANYQFAILQSCFIICSRLSFFCVLLPSSNIWLLYNREWLLLSSLWLHVLEILSIWNVPHTSSHLPFGHVRGMVGLLSSLSVLFSLFQFMDKKESSWICHIVECLYSFEDEQQPIVKLHIPDCITPETSEALVHLLIEK